MREDEQEAEGDHSTDRTVPLLTMAQYHSARAGPGCDSDRLPAIAGQMQREVAGSKCNPENPAWTELGVGKPTAWLSLT